MSPLLIAVAIGSLVSVLLGVLAFFKTRYQSVEVGKLLEKLSSLEEKSWKHEDRRSLENRLTAVETQIRLMEKYMGDVLHRDDTPELDKLIEKHDRGEWLTEEEARKFADELDQIRTDWQCPVGTRVAAGIKLSAIIVKYKLKERMELDD